MMKLLVAAGLTLVLIVANTKDDTAAKVRNFDIAGFFNVESNSVLSKNFDDEQFRDENAPVIDGSKKHSDSFLLRGTASHYADKFNGKLTANGEIFDMNGFTCAHKKLPFGTILKITNTENNRTTLVRVTDRGPYVGNRIIDLSLGAAKWIGNTALPKIKAEGFSSDKFRENLKENVKGNMFFAYSEDNDLKIVDSDSFEIKSTEKDFSTALRKYRELKKKSNINNVYLFVQANKMNVKYGKKGTFYVGQIKPENLFAHK